MSSAGHVLDMLNRFKANRQMLPSKGRKKTFGQVRAMYTTAHKPGFDPIGSSLTKTELAEIRKAVQVKIRKQRIRGLVITWIIAVVLIAGGIWLFIGLIS